MARELVTLGLEHGYRYISICDGSQVHFWRCLLPIFEEVAFAPKVKVLEFSGKVHLNVVETSVEAGAVWEVAK